MKNFDKFEVVETHEKVELERKIYSNKADADAQAATTVTYTLGDKTITYQPDWWKNSTVVTE